MIFKSVTFKKPTNSFIAAIQKYCHALIESPVENDINDLDALQYKLTAFINEQKLSYSRCKVDSIDTELHSYTTFQVLNLLQGDSKILIGLCARRTEYQGAFKEYDRERISFDLPPQS